MKVPHAPPLFPPPLLPSTATELTDYSDRGVLFHSFIVSSFFWLILKFAENNTKVNIENKKVPFILYIL